MCEAYAGVVSIYYSYIINLLLRNYISVCLSTAGEGCNFITANCDDWSYSCSPPEVDGCSYDYQATVFCVTAYHFIL